MLGIRIANNTALLKNFEHCGMFIKSSQDFFSFSSLSLVSPGPFNSMVGAIIKDGKFFITFPNQMQIYTSPISDSCPVYLHTDSQYGDDNPVL